MAQLPMILELRHSSIWHWGQRVLHAVLLVALLVVPWDWMVRIGLGFFILIAFFYVECQCFLPTTLKLDVKGRVSVLEGRDFVPAKVAAIALVHPWLSLFSVTWLNHQQTTKAKLVWVLPDSCSSGDFRRLRVWLTWESRLGQLRHQAAVLPKG